MKGSMVPIIKGTSTHAIHGLWAFRHGDTVPYSGPLDPPTIPCGTCLKHGSNSALHPFGMDHHRRCRDRVIGADCRIAVVVISAVAAGLTLIGEGVGSADAERWGFTLQFIGPSADPFKQGTYTVDHSALGTLSDISCSRPTD